MDIFREVFWSSY